MSSSEIAAVPPQYHDKAQREGANQLGMWTLIATEVLFFGGLFLAYFIYRITYPAAFSAGSHLLDFWAGTINTAVLLTSSVTMVLADVMIKQGRRQAMAVCILCTAVLGMVFVGIKFHEYHDMYRNHLVPGIDFSAPPAPPTELFLFLYFAMTGLHALHMLIGLGVMAWLLRLNGKGCLSASAHEPVLMVGLYWHFVDCVWVFLYPLLYLIPVLK